MTQKHLLRQPDQRAVDQVQRGGECGGQRVEGGLALRQRFGVAHELETWVDRIAQHVGDVVEVQRGEVARTVLHAQGTEGPGERVATVVVDVDVERLEARALGQESAATNAVAERWVIALKEGERRRDGRVVAVEGAVKCGDACGALGRRQGIELGAHRQQAFGREQRKHQRQRQVFLHRSDTA